ncbi:MAG: FIST N-terminal domain-containing protein [Bdellovibrio sp.]
MKSHQVHLRSKGLAESSLQAFVELKPQVILGFGDISWVMDSNFMKALRQHLPIESGFLGCSTAGEITNQGLFDHSFVLTGIRFQAPDSKVQVVSQSIGENQHLSGRQMGEQLKSSDLRGIFLMAPGLAMQGSPFLNGLKEIVGEPVVVTGGLAGDNGKFKQTATFLEDQVFESRAVAVGFYGPKIEVKHGVRAGFRSFGGVRQITRARNHFVYEIDGRPALEVYKEALGKHSDNLPQIGLMFPLAVLNNQKSETGLIRGVLNVDEREDSLFLGGDVKDGTFFKLMRAENQSLIAGAQEAARDAALGVPSQSFALMVSCIARRFVMGEAVDDEIEAALLQMKSCENIAGFYAYGEFGPFFTQGDCQLHNQTMTIGLISEKSVA